MDTTGLLLPALLIIAVLVASVAAFSQGAPTPARVPVPAGDDRAPRPVDLFL